LPDRLSRQAGFTAKKRRAASLCLWEKRELTRSEILAAVDIAEIPTAQGGSRIITEQSMLDLANEVKQRGRARFDAEQTLRS
jgi:hypothetical protein